MSDGFNSGIRTGPQLSIISALVVPLLFVIVFNSEFRTAIPNLLSGKSDWSATVDSLFSNAVLASLIGGSIIIFIASSFLQAITTVGLVVRGFILLVGLFLVINIVSIQRIDTYIDTHFLGVEASQTKDDCESILQIGDLGDSIRASLKGNPEASVASPAESKCGAVKK